MKKTYTIILIIIVVTSIQVNAQQMEHVSFRSQALGGAVYDDLDLVYDPIELRFVNRIHLFTNLSNLTSYNEQVFNNVSDNEFLFGASLGNVFIENLWSSLLVRYMNSQFSNPVSIDRDLDGFNDIFNQGNLKDVYNAYLDTDFDGLYDTRREISQEKENFVTNQRNMFILNNSMLFGSLTIGFKFALSNSTNENTISSNPLGTGAGMLGGVNPSDPSFDLTYYSYNLENDFMNQSWDENGDFLSKDEFSNMLFHLAAMNTFKFSGLDTFEVRFDAGYESDLTRYHDKDGYNGNMYDYSPDIMDYDNSYREKESVAFTREWDGGNINLGFGIKQVFARKAQRKNNGFWEFYLGMKLGSYDYTSHLSNKFSGRDSYFDGTDTLFQDYLDENTASNETRDNGDESRNMFFASYRVNIPLGEKVYAGIGALFRYEGTERTTDYFIRNTMMRDYELLDDTTDVNDFVETEASQSNANRSYEVSRYYYRIPVGIEYLFTESNKWSIRFGSIFEYYRTIENERMQITNSEARRNTVTRGDGTVDIDIEDNIYDSYSSHIKDARSMTTFVYGLGFRPTDHLQIDLIGFLGTTAGMQIIDADFFRTWKLSLSLIL